VSGAGFAEKAAAAWAGARAACARAAAAPAEGEAEAAARFACERAFSRGADGAEAALGKWRTTVDGGRAVGGFGAKAGALLEAALAQYDAATAGAEGNAARDAQRAKVGARYERSALCVT
jgi:hypothetical protein